MPVDACARGICKAEAMKPHLLLTGSVGYWQSIRSLKFHLAGSKLTQLPLKSMTAYVEAFAVLEMRLFCWSCSGSIPQLNAYTGPPNVV